MEILIMLGKFILSLSLLIVLHECGHFFPARWFNTRVEKFYLFFDPWFSLFKVKRGDTEYGIGWLPFGGYVKISGMIDESFDKEQMAGPPKPWEFRSKKAWQRLIIMLGGVTVNFILGIFVFGMIYFTWGEQFLPNDNAKYGIVALELGEELGLQSGDKIISVGGQKFEKFESSEVARRIITDDILKITVERDGRNVDLSVPEDFGKVITDYKNKDKSLFAIRVPTIVADIRSDYRDAKENLKIGDRIISIEGKSTPYFDQYSEVAQSFPNQKVQLGLLRSGDTTYVNTQLDSLGRVGFSADMTFSNFFDIENQEYGFMDGMARGWSRSMSFYQDQFKAFGKMFSGKLKATDSLGGPIMIASMFKGPDPTKWNWRHFWQLTAMLSLILAFMNLLPVPGLDGGHVMFLLYEVITGRKPNEKIVEYATLAGFIVLIILMVFIMGNDIMRFFRT